MSKTFKVGDRVRVIAEFDDNEHIVGKTGTIVAVHSYPYSPYLIEFDTRVEGTWDDDNIKSGWYVSADVIKHLAPSLADDLRLHPQDRTVLSHLKQGKPITPMKALVVYGLSRLAAQIHNIRKVGYNVNCTIERDESGHKYASYSLLVN